MLIDGDLAAGEAVSYAWAKIRADPGTLLGASLVGLGIMLLPGLLGQGLMFIPLMGSNLNTPGHWADPTWFGAVGALQLLGLIPTVFINAGICHLALKVVRGSPRAIGDIFACWELLPSLLLLQFLQFAAAAVGFVCFVVPALVLGAGLALSVPIAVDQKLGAIDAMKESWRLTSGHKWTITGIMGICGLLGLLTVCTCGLASVVLLPLSQLAMVYAYFRLSGQPVAPVAPTA